MDLTFAHYRNRFCMFRTYYALATGKVKPDGFNMKVIELPDPPSHEQEEALIRGDVQVANLYLPNFLRRKLEGAPIIGLSTEWKSTMKGNGIFVLRDGPVKSPKDLTGRLIATHQGAHAVHRYLLRNVYGVDDKTLRWESHPQEQLLGVLKSGKVDAIVLLDHFFFRGEVAEGVRCLYTDGEAWKKFRGFDQIIKHMVAAREDLLKEHPELKEKLLKTFRASFAYSESHLDEIGDAFIQRYGGDKEALLASAGYPKIEFTFTEQEQKLAEAEMEMLLEVGEIPRKAPLSSLFAI
ncbi:MAG TPA: ABC transporter substrate-binding protein [Candidatus Binatia bacterium]|nr:ABC transporter substrate-binding protein [Candidatus Binatia bacterium]